MSLPYLFPNRARARRQVTLSGVFTPLSLSPSLWLKADAGLYQERSSPTTPASSDGDPVGTWQDQSSNANHVVAPSDAGRPTYKVNIFNGLPAILLDGTDDYLSKTLAVDINQPTMLYVVYQTTDTDSILFDGITARQQLVSRFGGASYIWAGNAPLYSSANLTGASARIVAANFNGTSSKIWDAGTEVASGGNIGSNAAHAFVLGTDTAAGGSSYFSGYICEVIFYSGTHTTNQINQIGNHLSRWGVTWSNIP